VNVLLDTHVLIWWDEGRRIAAEARQAIEEADDVYVSAASAWEVAIKTALGRLRSTRTVEEAASDSGFLELPVTLRHAEWVTGLPPHHRDPFDRMLVAQAAVEELTLVTRDPVFARYGVALIKA
jgi:PIN domain nuclease of toxin-antitoxin system